jgi:peptidoglycan hydrolase-like protein with peptidoglycan-binding domain
MRAVAWVTVIVLALVSQAAAQAQTPAPAAQPAAKPKPAKKAAAKKEKEKPAGPAAPAATPEQRGAYAAMPVAERIAIQSDLIWTGDLSGSIDPDFGDRAIAAVRSFQRRNKFDETGILTRDQRQTLAASMRGRKDYNGWRLVEDEATPGVRLGIPAKLVPNSETGAVGSRWSSARGEIQIETFREKMAGASLQELFDEMKKRPSNRRVEQNSINTSSFSLSGMQGLKKFHVRAYLKDNEARGITILFDQAMETIMLPLVDIITVRASWCRPAAMWSPNASLPRIVRASSLRVSDGPTAWPRTRHPTSRSFASMVRAISRRCRSPPIRRRASI